MNSKMQKISYEINGVKKSGTFYPFDRLLDVIRTDQKSQLTGTKEGCGEGECGACSVLFNGELVNSCLVPIGQCEGASIKTVEGLAQNKKTQAVQKAFLEHGGAQCGICTPGMLMAAVELLEHNPQPTREEIRYGLGGNLCRCTGYVKIIDSIEHAARVLREKTL